jgi:hypothetical protein
MGILTLTNEHHKQSGTLKKVFGALYEFQYTPRCYFRPRKEVVVDLEEVGRRVRSGGLPQDYQPPQGLGGKKDGIRRSA